jgi:uncharacterized protein YjbJ (UPF0337 family)
MVAPSPDRLYASEQKTRRDRAFMNWDRIEGNWKQFKGSARQQWGRLTEDDLEVVGGRREHLAGKIQEAYGITREASEKQLTEWLARQHKVDPLHK